MWNARDKKVIKDRVDRAHQLRKQETKDKIYRRLKTQPNYSSFVPKKSIQNNEYGSGNLETAEGMPQSNRNFLQNRPSTCVMNNNYIKEKRPLTGSGNVIQFFKFSELRSMKNYYFLKINKR